VILGVCSLVGTKSFCLIIPTFIFDIINLCNESCNGEVYDMVWYTV